MGWQGKGGVGRRVHVPEPSSGQVIAQDTVLVVAEDLATRQSLIDVLASADVYAVGATAGEALSAQDQVHPAAAIVEHVWQTVDGVDLADKLKGRDGEVQVLLLIDPDSLDAAPPSAAVDGYLVKPLAALAFVQTVRGALSHRALVVANRDLATVHAQNPDAEEPNADDATSGAQAEVRAPASQLAEQAPDMASIESMNQPSEPEPLSSEKETSDEPSIEEQVAPVRIEQAEEPVRPIPANLSDQDEASEPWTLAPMAESVVVSAVAEAASTATTSAPSSAGFPAQELATEGISDADLVHVDDELRQVLTLPSPVTNNAGVFLVQLHLPSGYEDDWYRHSSAILARVSDRLTSGRRRTDKVTLLGESRFVVVCADVDSMSTAELIAAPIVRELSRPLQIGGKELPLGATLGIVLARSADGQSPAPKALLEDAFLALQLAGEEGKPWVVFDDQIGEGIRLRARVQRAMENGELGLDFQKVVDLQSRRIVGAEALLRWRRPGREVLRASDFLYEAWEVGLAVPLGCWVLDHALAEMASWRERGALFDGFKLSVNVSAEEVVNPEFAEIVEKLLRGHGVPPAMLNLEMPEAALGEAAAASHSVEGFRMLRDLGVGCVIDDFGTGRSNLDWLQQLPVSGLKITPELVSGLGRVDDRRGPALVRGVIALGHELQLMVVGEGVESEAEAVALRAMGCDLAQGNFVGEPERPDELANALAV